MLNISFIKNQGASWCNLTDDVTTCPMMTSLSVIELIMLGLVQGLGDVIIYDDITSVILL